MRYVYGAVMFISTVALVFVAIVALQRALGG
jgi:hypothetical protein